jgi:hypothetical protein
VQVLAAYCRRFRLKTTVNRLVAGSNPARGAIVSFALCLIRTLFFHGFFRFL